MGRRRILFSGFASDELDQFAIQVSAVGGTCCHSEDYMAECRHVVCRSLARTAKVMIALASGAWLLVPEYIENSFAASRWLPEEGYEWSPRHSRSPPMPTYVYEAPRRCRLMLAEGRRIFGGWVVAVVASDERRNVFEKILRCGGATVVPLPASPTSRRVAALTHVFTDVTSDDALKAFGDKGVLCLSLDYIRNVLFRGPDVESSLFAITHYRPGRDPLLMDVQRMSGGSPLAPVANQEYRRKRQLVAPELPLCQKRQRKPAQAVKSRSGPMDRFVTRKENLIPVVKLVDIRKSSEERSDAEVAVVPLEEAPRVRIAVSHDVLTNSVAVLCAQEEEEPLWWLEPALEVPWRRRDDTSVQKVTAEEAPASMTMLLEACFEMPHYELESIQFAHGLLSSSMYPQPQSTSHILWNLLLLRPLHVSSKAFALLDAFLTTHPPTSARMQRHFERIICDGAASGWGRIVDVMRVLSGADGAAVFGSNASDIPPSDLRRNCLMALEFLVALLQADFRFVVAARRKTPSVLTLLERLVWPGGRADHTNSAVCRLLETCVDVATMSHQEPSQVVAMEHSTRLLALVAYCCSMDDKRRPAAAHPLLPDCGRSLTALAHALVQCIDGRSAQVLGAFLHFVRPPLLRLKVSQFYLDRRQSRPWSGGRLGLGAILSRYLPLDATFAPPARRGATPAAVVAAVWVNRKNAKGETPLHRACIKNDPVRLRCLLSVPGVDVNITDHAGWTPLHEACNHGSTECVSELLAFQPPRPIHDYFVPGSQRRPAASIVDVRAATIDGVTPLHDAVVNGHLDVVRLLLQFGGQELVAARMTDGRNALDLAKTPQMLSILRGDATPSTQLALSYLCQAHVEVHRLHRLWEVASNGTRAATGRPTAGHAAAAAILREDLDHLLGLRHRVQLLQPSNRALAALGL